MGDLLMGEHPTGKPTVKRALWFVGVLTCWILTSFLVSVVLLYFFEIPPTNRETLVYMLGQLSGLTTACVMFWVGTTHGSTEKTNLLAKAEPIKET